MRGPARPKRPSPVVFSRGPRRAGHFAIAVRSDREALIDALSGVIVPRASYSKPGNNGSQVATEPLLVAGPMAVILRPDLPRRPDAIDRHFVGAALTAIADEGGHWADEILER